MLLPRQAIEHQEEAFATTLNSEILKRNSVDA